MRITKFERRDDGDGRPYWRANVTADGRTVRFDDSCGSWMAPWPQHGRKQHHGPARTAPRMADAPRAIALALSERARHLERPRRNPSAAAREPTEQRNAPHDT